MEENIDLGSDKSGRKAFFMQHVLCKLYLKLFRSQARETEVNDPLAER
jgi:hypothetical protein